MRPSVAPECHRADIRRLVEAHRTTNLRIFGSVAYGKATDVSDLDLFVDTVACIIDGG